MIKKIKKGLAVLAAAAMAAGCLTGCSSEIDCEEIVATIGDEEISMGVAAMYVRHQQAETYHMYESVYGATNVFDAVYDTVNYRTFGELMKVDLLSAFEELYLAKEHAADYGVELTDEEVAEIEAAADAFIAANDTAVLESIGTCRADIIEYLSLQKYHVLVKAAMTVDVDRDISDEEAAKSKLSYVKIAVNDEVDLDTAKATAEEIIAKIQEEDDIVNADLGALAQEVDEGLYSSVSTFDDEVRNMDAAIYAAVEGFADGELVEKPVVASDESAVFVVRMDANLDRTATDLNKQSIIQEREQAVYDEIMVGWLEESDFEVVQKVWDKLEINDRDVYQKIEETEEDTATGEESEETAE